MPEAYAIGHLTLHPHRELLDGGAAVAIGGRALDLLSVLAAADGGVVTKDELLARVWNGAIVEDNALQAQVSAVRKALGSEAHRLITMHGRGYRLELDEQSTAAPIPVEANSIAVTAFHNRSGDPSHDYLATGIAEDLISALSRIPTLKVPAANSSFAYRGKGRDVRTIARELGVARVLEGQVRVAGDRLQVTITLISGATGFHQWTKDFERGLGDLLALQDELARAVAAALRSHFVPRIAGPASSDAMHLVLQAREMARTLNVGAVRRSEALMREVIAADPDYATAWEGLAGTLYVMTILGIEPEGGFEEARYAANYALSLDAACASARGILMSLAAMAGDWLKAAENHARMSEAKTVHPGIFGNYAVTVLLPAGRLAQASQVAGESLALAPAQPHLSLLCAVCALASSDLVGAGRHLTTALLLGERPDHPSVEIVRSAVAYVRGAFDDAAAPMLDLVRRELHAPAADVVVQLVFAALAGRIAPAAASQAAAELFAAADRSGALWRNPDTAGLFLRWQARFGAADAVFTVARRIVDRWRETGRIANGSLIPLWNRDMAPLRSDPRFNDIVRDLGFFDFWERYGPPDGHAVREGRLIVL